jgi:uncharacterized coiled-coil DUF342 family protein
MEERHLKDLLERNQRVDVAVSEAAVDRRACALIRAETDALIQKIASLETTIKELLTERTRNQGRTAEMGGRLSTLVQAVKLPSAEIRTAICECIEEVGRLSQDVQASDTAMLACQQGREDAEERAHMAEKKLKDLSGEVMQVMHECKTGLDQSRAKSKKYEDAFVELQRGSESWAMAQMKDRCVWSLQRMPMSGRAPACIGNSWRQSFYIFAELRDQHVYSVASR